MSAPATHAPKTQPAEFRVDPARIHTARIALLAAGLALIGVSAVLTPAHHFHFVYLASFGFTLTICLGALFFTLIHHLVGARWSVVLRRLSEALAMNLPLMLLLFIPILYWMSDLYARWDGPAAAADEIIKGKAAWLNPTAFTVRAMIYFLFWIVLGWWLYSRSVKNDQSGDPYILLGLRKVSAPGMLLYAITLTFAAFDWFMSLAPKWYSTIFGVYYFADGLIAIYSVLILLSLWLAGSRAMGDAVTVEHYHDMGKLLFGFNVFWAYIAVSQLILIWMANIPEETIFFIERWKNPGWRAMSWFLVNGHFIVPFFYLLSRTVKRTRPLLAIGAVWMLFMTFIDLYWLVLPTIEFNQLNLMWTDFALPLGFLGIFFAAFLWRLEKSSAVAYRDPFLQESLAFENM